MASPCRTLHRAPVGQGPPGPGWLAISLGFWPGRALATGTAWAGVCLIRHHQDSIATPITSPTWGAPLHAPSARGPITANAARRKRLRVSTLRL